MLPDLTTREINIICRALSLFQATVKGCDSELARSLYTRLAKQQSEDSELPSSMVMDLDSFPEPPG
jgi:hypothetical protein